MMHYDSDSWNPQGKRKWFKIKRPNYDSPSSSSDEEYYKVITGPYHSKKPRFSASTPEEGDENKENVQQKNAAPGSKQMVKMQNQPNKPSTLIKKVDELTDSYSERFMSPGEGSSSSDDNYKEVLRLCRNNGVRLRVKCSERELPHNPNDHAHHYVRNYEEEAFIEPIVGAKESVVRFVVEDKELVVEGEELVVEGEVLVVEDIESVVEDIESVVEDKELVVEGEDLVVEGEVLVVEDIELVVANKELVVQGKELVVEGMDSVVENIESAVEDKELVVEDKELVVESEKLVVEGKEQIVEEVQTDFTLFSDQDPYIFEWRDVPPRFSLPIERFTVKNTGPVQTFTKALDAFRAIWTDDLLTETAEATNKNAREKELIAIEKWNMKNPNKPYENPWVDTTPKEILLFLSFIIIIAVKNIDRSISIEEKTPFKFFSTKARFTQLCKYISFQTTEKEDYLKDESKNKLLYQIDPLLSHLNQKFKELFVPDKIIALDSSVVFRHRLKKNQVHCLELADAATNFVVNIIIDTDEETSHVLQKKFPKCKLRSAALVLESCECYLDKGYSLYLTDCLTSTVLCRYLKQRKTDCSGPLDVYSKWLPPKIKNIDDEKLHEMQHCGDMIVVGKTMPGMPWGLERGDVWYRVLDQYADKCVGVSTFHRKYKDFTDDPDFVRRRMIAAFTRNMKCFKHDFVNELYLPRKSTRKCHFKILLRLINVTVRNSRVLYARGMQDPRIDLITFRKELIRDLFELYRLPLIESFDALRKGDYEYCSIDNPLDIPERFDCSVVHMTLPVCFKFNKKTATSVRLLCIWCKKLMAFYKCNICDVPLCIERCFDEYHTPLQLN